MNKEIKIVQSLESKKKDHQIFNANDLVKKIEKNEYRNIPLFEIIDETNEYIKPYFDYESYHKKKITDERRTSILLKLKSTIKNILFFCDPSFSISESTYTSKNDDGLYKYSFHITCPNIIIKKNNFFELVKSMKLLFKKNDLDTAPYMNYQKFRLVGTSKKDTKSPLKIIEDENYLNHFITYYDDTLPKISINELLLSLSKALFSLGENHYDNRNDWRIIAGKLKTVKYDQNIIFNLFNSFSTLSDKYLSIDDCRQNYDDADFKNLSFLDLLQNCEDKIAQKIFLKEKKNKEKEKKNKEREKIEKDKQIYKLQRLNEIEESKNEVNKEYLEIKQQIEKNYFFIENMALFGFEKEIDEENDDDDNKSLIFFNYQQLIIKFKKYFFIEESIKGPVKKYFLDLWNEDIEKRKYNEIIFNPSPNYITNQNYNLFDGFHLAKQQPKQNIDISIFHKLLDHVLGKYKQSVLLWVAHILKYRTKTEQCIILYSDMHGVGKNCVVSLFTKLFGRKYTTKIEKIEDLSKEFNSKFENKLFCYGDEIVAKNREFYNDFKNVITRTEININKKGIDNYLVYDRCNYLFTTNIYNPIKMEFNDRRSNMINCNEEVMPEIYYREFGEALKDTEKLRTFFYELINMEVPTKLKIIASDMKKDLQNIYLESPIKFLYENMNNLENKFVSKKTLFEYITNYSKERKYTDLSTIQQMTKIISKINDYDKVKDNIRGFLFTNLKNDLEKFNKQIFDENLT